MLPVFFGLTTFIFALIASYFAYRFERKEKEVKDKEKEIQRKIYELNVLNDIAERVGYSLNIESIAETVALSVGSLFDLSTVSYALKNKGNTIFIKNFLKENVTLPYTQSVGKIMVDAMVSLDPDIKGYQITEEPSKYVAQINSEAYFDAVPLSYFNIPLVVNNEFMGVINISSRKKGIYQDADMSLLYKVVNTAQKTINKVQDVTETEKAKLNSLVLSLPSGSILFSFEKGEFSLSLINRAAKGFLKVDDNADLAMVVSRFPQEVGLVKNIKDVINEKKSLIIQRTKIFDKYFRIYVTPVFFHNSQQIIGVSIAMRDMTAEEKIEKIRDDFTNMLIHELRAPLTAIKGASSLLISHTLSEEENEKMIKVIGDSSKNMLDTVSDLLDVAKIEQGKMTLNKTDGDISSLIKEHIGVFTYVAREKNISIHFEDKKLPSFLFDSVRMGQVINNLLSNSLKFTNNGGKIDVEIAEKNGQIEVIVSDTGIGIPQDKKAFLFTKFGQIDHSKNVTGQNVSSGLGLFICKEIVEAHGGKIWVDSKEGVGTKVGFELPINSAKKIADLSEFAN